MTAFDRFCRQVTRQIVAAGGTGPDAVRCPCGAVVTPRQWDQHRATCLATTTTEPRRD